MLRTIVCVALVSVACGKRGSAPVPGIGSGSAVLELGAGSAAPNLTVTVLRSEEVPAIARPHSLMLGAHFKVVAVIEVAPANLDLPPQTRLLVTIDPSRIMTGRTTADLRAVVLRQDPKILDVPVAVSAADKLVLSPSTTGVVLVLSPLKDVTLLGTAADDVRGATALVMRGDCTTWLNAGPRMTALATSSSGLVIGADKSLKLGASLAPKPVEPVVGDPVRADDVLARGAADPNEAAVVLASILLAQGHPVRLSSGRMTYESDGKKLTGVQQWAEVVLDGAPWFVDTRDVAHPALIPLAKATSELALDAGRSCAAYPPGASTDAAQWTTPAPPTK